MSKLITDQKERVATWVAEEVEQTAEWGSYYAMGIEKNDQLIAGVVFNNFNGSNATAHIAIKEKTMLLPYFLTHCFRYAFENCQLKRLTGLVEADNEKALKFDRHIGFVDEFVMRKAGAKGQDMIVLVMWPDKCKWL